MTIRRILAAIDDSAPALAAAAYAAELARTLGAELHFVTVVEEGRDATVILHHVRSMAEHAGVTPEVSAVTDGKHPYEVLLAAATSWGADLVVMGRSDKRRTGRPYVGSQTENVLEFTEVPVLVVPDMAARG